MDYFKLFASLATLLGIHAWYDRFIRKPKVKLHPQITQYDYTKYNTAYLDPINEFQLLISNHSKDPVVIRDIKLCYKNTQESEKGELDRLANYQINKLKNMKLNQAEEQVFRLSYVSNNDKLVLDRLESITVILTSGHEYKVPNQILKPLIENLKLLKPPDLGNLEIARRRERNGNALCKRQD